MSSHRRIEAPARSAQREGSSRELRDLLPRLGRWALGYLYRLGHGAFFFVELLKSTPASLRRLYLVVAQVHAIGNYSVVIITASGLAVASCSACRATTRSAATAPPRAWPAGGAVAGAGTGPVVTALLFAGRAGTSLTARSA